MEFSVQCGIVSVRIRDYKIEVHLSRCATVLQTFAEFRDYAHRGMESTHFGKRSLTPPNFILEQQTVSHMKTDIFSLNLIPYC